MKVLTCSRFFPKGHPNEGQPTEFIEKILIGLRRERVFSKAKCAELARGVGLPESHPMHYIDTFDNYQTELVKWHTIRLGSRWKVGDQASLRVWVGKPYRSKQVEFAQVTIKKIIEIDFDGMLWWVGRKAVASDTMGKVANNDGLSLADFRGWFPDYKPFSGQILCFHEDIDYSPQPARQEKEAHA